MIWRDHVFMHPDLKWLKQSGFGIRSTRPSEWQKKKMKMWKYVQVGGLLFFRGWSYCLPKKVNCQKKQKRIADSFQVTLGLSVTNNPQYHQLSFSNNRKLQRNYTWKKIIVAIQKDCVRSRDLIIEYRIVQRKRNVILTICAQKRVRVAQHVL